MKKFIIPFFVVLLFTSCPDTNRSIEAVYCRTIERNYSTYNLFIQYYLKDGTITRKKIYKGTENRIEHILCDDYLQDTSNRDKMLENNYHTAPGGDPEFSGNNPNKMIQKILFIDIDTNTIIKRLEYNNDWYFLGFADINWDMRARWKYWILDITNEWLLGT